MKPKLNLRKWQATTALCVVSMVAVATAGYAASNMGRSSWDLRSHPNRFINKVDNLLDKDSGIKKPGKGNGGGDSSDGVKTVSPIKHVIVLIGENRGLDHTFGVYKPKGKGETISNLLSKGIVNEDGTPGPNFAQAQQFSVAAQSSYYIGAPAISKSPYSPTNLMPQPNTEGTARLMAAFAPHRSIATMHLWTYLRETRAAA